MPAIQSQITSPSVRRGTSALSLATAAIGAFCALASVVPVASAAEIFWVSDPVKPGEAVLVIGEDFGPAPRVSITRLGAADASAVGDKRTLGPGELLAHGPQSLTFELPRDMAPGAFEISVEGTGKVARRHLNAAVVYWTQGDLGTAASPGGSVRVFGRTIAAAGATARLALRREPGGSAIDLAASNGDLWEARFTLPADLPEGSYALSLDNGLGGEATRVAAGAIQVTRAAPRPTEVFDVKSFGAAGDGKTDDTAALLRAIENAGRKGGGTIYLPPGRYQIAAGLELPRHVTLAGESRDATALMFTDFDAPPFALISGTSDFAVRDLAIFASNHKHVIAGIDHERPNAEKGRVAIERVRVRAMHLRRHVTPDEIAQKYRSSLKFENDTVRLGGADLRIVDNDLLGSGRSLALYDARGGLVAGNTLYNGRIGWYSLTGPDGVIFENNQILGADLMSTGGGVNVLSGRPFSRNVIFRNNRFERLLGWDREAITSDGGGGYIYGRAVAEAPDRLRVSGEINEKWSKNVPDWTGASFFILGGRGRGQWARIARLEGDMVTLERPLAVPPDTTSVITITQLHQNYLFIGNSFEDVGSAIQYYGTSIDHVAADNRASRSFGFLASGRWYRHYQPSWFCQFIGNEVRNGQVYRSGPNAAFTGEPARIALWGLQRPPNKAPLLLGGVLRGNRLRDASFIELKGGNNPSAPGISDVIVENNSIESKAPGLSVDKGVTGVLLR